AGSGRRLGPWRRRALAGLSRAGVVGPGGILLLVRAGPGAFLGADGLWMLQQVRQVVAKLAAKRPAAAARHRVVVELVGPAGVGKSTVADALRNRDDTLRASIWGLPLRLVSWSVVPLLPTFVALCLQSRRVPWEEMQQML